VEGILSKSMTNFPTLDENSFATVAKRGNDSLETIAMSRTIAEKQIYHQNLLNSSDIVLFMDCLKSNILPLVIKGMNITNQDLLKDFQPREEEGHNEKKEDPDEDFPRNIHSSKNSKQVKQPGGVSLTTKLQERLLKNTPVLVKNNFIISIDLNHYGLGSDRGICLSEIFVYCPSLEILKIANNSLNDYCLFRILDSLWKHTHCIYLDVSENKIEEYAITVLTGEIMKPESRLEYLNINNCDMTDQFSACVAEALSYNSKVEVVLMKSGRTGKDEVRKKI
jgi:hypothetical protein